MHKRNPIHMLLHMRQHAGDVLPRFTRRHKWPRASHQVTVFSLEAEEIFFTRQRLAVALIEFWFMFPQIEVRSGSRAKNLQNAFCAGRKVRFHFLRRAHGRFARQKFAQPHPHHCSRYATQRLGKKISPVMCTGMWRGHGDSIEVDQFVCVHQCAAEGGQSMLADERFGSLPFGRTCGSTESEQKSTIHLRREIGRIVF